MCIINEPNESFVFTDLLARAPWQKLQYNMIESHWYIQ